MLDRPPEVWLDAATLALLDWDAITAEMLAWKRARGFHNLLIGRETLRAILAERRYVLNAPLAAVQPARFADVPRVQGVASAILRKYAERFYMQTRRCAEARHLQYHALGRSHANLQPNLLADGRPGYLVKVNRSKPDLVEQVRELIAEGNRLWQKDAAELPNVYFDRHLYQPLLAAGVFTDDETFKLAQDIRTVPVALNRGEANFPRRLREYLVAHPATLGDRKLYLLRNQSRGKGIGFFEAGDFYPDFILWLVKGGRQRIVFVDPKGLVMLKPNDFSHDKIQLFRTLQGIAARIADPDITLDSFIISEQSFTRTQPNFGNGRHTREDFETNHILFPGDPDLAAKVLG